MSGAKGLGACLETLFEAELVGRNLPLGLAPSQRREELADAVSLEVDFERQPRSCPVVEGLDGDRAGRAYGSVDDLEPGAAWRVVLDDLVGGVDRYPARQSPPVGCSGADLDRPVGVDRGADDRLLPLPVRVQLVEVGVHVLGRA